MHNTYFLDESGNTGDIVSMSALTGFANQPFFVLASIGLNDIDSLNSFHAKIIKDYRIQASELKSKNVCSNNAQKKLQ